MQTLVSIFCCLFLLAMPPAVGQSSKPSSSGPDSEAAVEAAHAHRGLKYCQDHRVEEAVAEFDKCKHLDRLDDVSLIEVIRAYTEAEEHDRMLPLANLLVERQQKSKTPVPDRLRMRAFHCRANCNSALHRYNQAGADFKMTALLEKDDKGFVAQRFDDAGSNYRLAKNYAKAIECLNLARGVDPRNPFVFFHLAQVYDDQGQWTEGLPLLTRAIDICIQQRKREPEAYSFVIIASLKERITCLEKLGKYAKAAEDKKYLGSINAGWNDTLFGGREKVK